MSVGLTDTTDSLRHTLEKAIDRIGHEDVTLRRLVGLVGEQAYLILCALLTIPFLFPVSIPGVSTVFGLAIILIAVGITTNRQPWLPARLMDRKVDGDKLRGVLERGLAIAHRIEKFIRPRLVGLTHGAAMSRLNGLILVLGGILLMFPLGLVPFSNTLPAFAILFLSVGMAQRDGLLVLAGYGMTLATVVYFAILFFLALAAGRGLFGLIGA